MARRRTPRNRTDSLPSENYRAQSDLIIQCARKCFETKGVRKTTLVDIAREANMTRELIYYYYSGKEEILEQFVESYIQDAVDSARLWCDTWSVPASEQNQDLPYEALVDAVATVRRFVYSADGKKRSMFQVLDELGCRHDIFVRMCSTIIRSLGNHPTAQRLGRQCTNVVDSQSEFAFMFVVLGAIGLMEGKDVSNEQIVDLLCPHAA